MPTAPQPIPPYRVYFFIPLPEPLSIPERQYQPDIFGDTPGAGVLTNLPAADGPFYANSISMYVRRILAPPNESGIRQATLNMIRSLWPWEIDGGAGVDETDFEPAEDWIKVTVIEVSAIMPPDWRPRSMRHDEDMDPVLEERLSQATEGIRILQNLDYLLTRIPRTVVSPHTLPSTIYFTVGLYIDGDLRPAPEGTLGLFANFSALESQRLRQHVEEGRMDDSIDLPRTPYEKVLELMRETATLLHLDGNYRSSIVMAAATCESLVTMTLMFLTWESGICPDECKPKFDRQRQASTKVKTDLRQFLPGSWDMTSVQALRDWDTQVARPRNLVIHYGYRVRDDFAHDAWRTTTNFIQFLADRLWESRRRFPGTVFTYLSSFQTMPSNMDIEDFEREAEHVVNDFPEVGTFERWVYCLEELLNVRGNTSEPSVTSGGLVAIYDPHGKVHFVWHDWQAGMACLAPEPDAQTRHSVDQRYAEHGGSSYTIFSLGAPSMTIEDPQWLSEHRLIPGIQVLADYSDLRL